MAQSMFCQSMPMNAMMWPVGQTAEGGLVFASMVPPSNAQAYAGMHGMSTEFSSESTYSRNGMHAAAQTRRARFAKPAPASTDALTSDEIEQMRKAVEDTRRKLQESGSFESVRQDCFSGVKKAYNVDEREYDTASTSSSTGIPESRLESEDAADDDANSNFVWCAAKALDEHRISDMDVDNMFSELESNRSDRRKVAIEWIISSTRTLSLTRRGCRIVQRAMELATSMDQERIVANLEGFVLEALQSPHANYVLQKCIEIMPSEKLQFVVVELQGQAVCVARHRFGCRILQRVMERCTAAQSEELILELLMDAPQLVRHTYGNFVIQHVLQYGDAQQIHQIAEVLLTDAIRFAKHRIASHVVSCAVSCCAPDDVQRLTEVLLGEKAQVEDLMHRQYGSYVVREVNRAKTRLCDIQMQ